MQGIRLWVDWLQVAILPAAAPAHPPRHPSQTPTPTPPPHPHPQLILEELDTHLLVFSPYLALTKLLASDSQLADLGQNAWAALNDTHRTDLPLVHAPHMLALGCVYLASVICSRDIRAWLQTVDVDLNEVRLGFCMCTGGRGRRVVCVASRRVVRTVLCCAACDCLPSVSAFGSSITAKLLNGTTSSGARRCTLW